MKFSELLTLFKEGKGDAKSHIKNLLEIAIVDGHFDTTEEDLLAKLAKRHSVSKKQLEQIRNNPSEIPFEVPKDPKIKFNQLFELVHMMVVDKYIDSDETKLCGMFAKKFGYNPEKADELVLPTASCETANTVSKLVELVIPPPLVSVNMCEV